MPNSLLTTMIIACTLVALISGSVFWSLRRGWKPDHRTRALLSASAIGVLLVMLWTIERVRYMSKVRDNPPPAADRFVPFNGTQPGGPPE